MKRVLIIAVSVLMVAALVVTALPVLAAKPPQVITVSNGFPSGMHFNLNIHGKNPETFTTPSPPPYDPPYGNSIFIPEYTEPYAPITIECISNKKGGTDFGVIDPYAMPTLWSDGTTLTGYTFADDLAQFNLPYKIQTDDGIIDSNGYYVYGRIHGKPNNGNNLPDGESNIIVTPSPLLQVDSDGITFAAGLVTTKGSYVADDSGTFKRFDDTSSIENGKGKGRSIARNITDMFMWTGWVVDGSLDDNEDGVIDFLDVPAAYDTLTPFGEITQEEFDNWLTDMADLGLARYYEDWWVFDIADIVIQSWGIKNDGTKLLQIRFYPVATTKFTEKAHIVINKVTDPIDDTTTLFDFVPSYRSSFQMTSNQFSLSRELGPGNYDVTELVPDGWDLTYIDIQDPTGGSYDSGSTAYIDLAEGETVTVTFTNTQRGHIIVDKITDPSGVGELFDFSLTGGPDTVNQTFQLADVTTPYDSGAIKPGTYSVTETIPLGWDLTSAVCSDGSPVDAIDLDPGEIVTVTFYNELLPT
jgi:hypothetical protein